MRSGYIFAHDPRGYSRWLSSQRVYPGAVASSSGGGLAGAELEEVLSAMLMTNPDIIAVRVSRG